MPDRDPSRSSTNPNEAIIPARRALGKNGAASPEMRLKELPTEINTEEFSRRAEAISGMRFRDEESKKQFTGFMEKLADALEIYVTSGAGADKRNPEPLTEIDDILLRMFILGSRDEVLGGAPNKIESILHRIQVGITEYLRKHPRKNPIGAEDIDQQIRLRARGLESMVIFLHARSSERLPEGANRRFYTQTRLDARFSTDVIEVIEREAGDVTEISELNFIQVKSSDPAPAQVRDMQRAHSEIWHELWGGLEDANQRAIESFRLSPEQLHDRVLDLLGICADIQAGGDRDRFINALIAEVMVHARQYGVNPEYLRKASKPLCAKRLTPILKSFLSALGEKFNKAFEALDQISKGKEGAPPDEPFLTRGPLFARIKEVNSLIVVSYRNGSYGEHTKNNIASGVTDKTLILKRSGIDPEHEKK